MGGTVSDTTIADLLAGRPLVAILRGVAPSEAVRIAQDVWDSGLGVVEVPNFDMVLRNHLFSEFISDHLFYFTAETLRTTLTVNGFEVVECGERRDDYIISAVVRKRRRLDMTEFRGRQARVERELNEFLGERWEVIGPAFGPAVINRNVLALRVAEFPQALPEGFEQACARGR